MNYGIAACREPERIFLFTPNITSLWCFIAYDWLRVARLLASFLTFSAPVATASAALSLASFALSLASPTAFLTGAGVEPPMDRAPTRAMMVTRRPPMAVGTSGTNFMASIGSFWAMVMKRSHFSLMKKTGSSKNFRSEGDLGLSLSLGLSASSRSCSWGCLRPKVSSASLLASSTEWPM